SGGGSRPGRRRCPGRDHPGTVHRAARGRAPRRRCALRRAAAAGIHLPRPQRARVRCDAGRRRRAAARRPRRPPPPGEAGGSTVPLLLGAAALLLAAAGAGELVRGRASAGPEPGPEDPAGPLQLRAVAAKLGLAARLVRAGLADRISVRALIAAKL